MNDADTVARGIADKIRAGHGACEEEIAAALREYGDERAIKQLKVDQIYLDAERKKADAEGYRRRIGEEKSELMDRIRDIEIILQRGDRQGGGE